MTVSDPTWDEDNHPTVTTAAAFHDALEGLVAEAASNGVDLRGDWSVVHDGGDGDDATAWSIEFTRLAERRTTKVPAGERPVMAVLEAVAARKDVDVTELPALSDAVDPTLLEAVDRADGTTDQSATFEYCGYQVTVEADGTVTVDDLPDA